MAKIIDISDRIKNEKVALKIGEKEYALDNSKNAVLRILALWKNADAEGRDKISAMEETLEIAVGKEAAADFDQLTFEDYSKVLPAVMGAITGKDPEEYEASFRGEE